MVLGIVADVDVVPHIQLTRGTRFLLEKHLGQGGLPRAIFSDKGHFLLTCHDEVQSFKHGQIFKALLQGFGFENHLAGARSRREAEANLHVLGRIHFDAFELVELFDEALRESGLVLLRTEFVDEHLRFLDVLLLVFGGLFLAAALFFAPHLVGGVGPFVVVQLDPANFHGSLGEGVQKHPVV